MRFDVDDLLHPLVSAAGELRAGMVPPAVPGVLVALDGCAHVVDVHAASERLDELGANVLASTPALRLLWMATARGPSGRLRARAHAELASELRSKYQLASVA